MSGGHEARLRRAGAAWEEARRWQCWHNVGAAAVEGLVALGI